MVFPVSVDSRRAPRDSDYVEEEDLSSWINMGAFEDDAKLTDQPCPSTQTGKGNNLAQPEAFQCNLGQWASGELLSEVQSELGITDNLLSELQSAPMQLSSVTPLGATTDGSAAEEPLTEEWSSSAEDSDDEEKVEDEDKFLRARTKV